MSDLIKASSVGNTNGPTPFDRIKQTRHDGSEYWSARQLQSLMAYSSWQRLEVPIARAMQAASNTGMDVDTHFTRSVKNPSELGGRPREDYLLSRQAAYLVAMNGDPNKPEVAAAQSYFAVRTMQAEVAEQEHDELPAWARSQIETIRRVGKIEVEQERQRVRIDNVEHRLDGIEGKHDWYSALAYAKKAGLKTSVAATQALGRVASRLCRARGIQPDKAPHAHYGEVNTYPEDVLIEAAHALSAAV